MSQKKRRPKYTSVNNAPKKTAVNAKMSRRKKTISWLAGFGTLVLGGALANLFSDSAQQQLISSNPSTSNATAAPLVSRQAPTSRHLVVSKPTPSSESGPPLTVISEDPIDPNDIGGVWTFPGKIELSNTQLISLNNMRNINDQDDWFFAHGGAEPSTDTQLVVQNNHSYMVRVIDMNVIKSCATPLTGTLFYSPDQGGDGDVRLGFNLDSPDTEAEGATGWYIGEWKPDYFANYTVSIQPGSQQVFNLRTVVTKYSCTFEYQLTILEGEKKVNQLINDGGQPFHVSALSKNLDSRDSYAAYQVMYAGGVANSDSSGRAGGYARVNPRTYGY